MVYFFTFIFLIMKWKYSIEYNEYQEKYIVFKELEGSFVFKSVFNSEKKKDCVAYVKKAKGRDKKNAIKNNKRKN